MAFDSEGNFVRVHNWEQDRLNDIGILSDRHDEEDNNFANALNECALRDGRVAFSGNLKMGGCQIKNLANGTASSDAVTKSQLEGATESLETALVEAINAMVPIGDIKPSLQTANHGNWLLCNGQAVSRTDYADLFSLIGTNFGAGDGVTTFNMPDYRGKFLRGLGGDSAADIYTTQSEGLPAVPYTRIPQGSTAYDSYSSSGKFPANTWGYETVNATNTIYGASDHVTPVNQAVNWFIKALEEV